MKWNRRKKGLRRFMAVLWIAALTMALRTGACWAEPPESAPEEDAVVIVYYNPSFGVYYHIDPLCPSVHPDFLPLTPIPLEEIDSEPSKYRSPCPRCGAPDQRTLEPASMEEEWWGTDQGDSGLRTLTYCYGVTGLKSLRITMHGEEEHAFVCDSFPPYCYLDLYHDGNAILIGHYAEMAQNSEIWDEFFGEHWFMTFEFLEDTWRLTHITNGWDWMADVENGVYTFDDYYEYRSKWQWTVEFEDRLQCFDFPGMARLVEMYNAAMPARPSLHEEELE